MFRLLATVPFSLEGVAAIIVRAARIPRRSVKYVNSELDDRGLWSNNLSIHLERKDLINVQQMEVAVHGPDGATHLILCTGVANLGSISHKSYTFLVGPQISRRQFVGAIASGALSTIQMDDKNADRVKAETERGANLVLIDASYDDESGQVKVRMEVLSSIAMTRLAISYNVSILAELPTY